MAKVGAKGKYEYWLTKEGQIRLWGWSIDGLTDADIAKNAGISLPTLYEWKKKYPEISNALKESKEVADRAVENALFNRAIAGENAAMFFWLKNRKRNEWRERIENSIVTEEPIKIQMDYTKLSDEELDNFIRLAEKAKIK